MIKFKKTETWIYEVCPGVDVIVQKVGHYYKASVCFDLIQFKAGGIMILGSFYETKEDAIESAETWIDNFNRTCDDKGIVCAMIGLYDFIDEAINHEQ